MKNLALSAFLLIAAIPAFSQIPKSRVSKFQYLTNNQTITSLPVDTALAGSQNHHPLFSSFGSWSDLGNTGLPALINQYRPVREALNPIIFEGADGYGVNNSSLAYYSANSPFSMLNYNSGGTADKNGQTIKAIFGRNLKNNSNITVLGNYYNSDGHFDNQICNSSLFQANYIFKRNNYSLHTGLSRHSFTFSENGGIKSDDQLGAVYPSTIPVNLTGASTKMSFLTWQGIQSFPLSFSRKSDALPLPADSIMPDSLSAPIPVTPKLPLQLVHSFRISNTSRKYTDIKSDAGFYRNTYSEDLATKDSVSFLTWKNDVSLMPDTLHLGKHPVMVKGGFNPDFYRYQYADSISYGYSFGLNGRITKSNTYSFMQLAGKWIAAGYPAGDYMLAATYRLVPARRDSSSEISIELFANGFSPDPVIREYQSNHFRWNNDFNRQHESGLIVKWSIPKIRTAFEANVISNTNRIYFDTLGLPAQMNSGMLVFSFKGSKSFSGGPFRSTITALVQHSTSDGIRLPMVVGSTSTYMHHDIKFPATRGELQVEYGFDLTYSTSYYGYSYMPSTGIFFGENEKMLGNYPNLTGFAQMKVKRTRIFVAWCQTFADLMPEQSFAVLHYPSMRPHLKYGIYWHFYD